MDGLPAATGSWWVADALQTCLSTCEAPSSDHFGHGHPRVGPLDQAARKGSWIQCDSSYPALRERLKAGRYASRTTRMEVVAVRVFISHSHNNEEFVDGLQQLLRSVRETLQSL